MSVYRTCLPLLLTAVLSGCHTFGPLVKRDSETNCPTDIRRTVPWCAGEDAIFHCPCGPSTDYYGHKPTCWRTWPSPATVWRDAYCGACLNGTCAPMGENDMMVLPPSEEVPTPLETIEGPTTEGETGAPPTLEPLPPTSSTSQPSQQSVARSSAGTAQAKSGLVRRLRETPRTANSKPVPQAPSAVRQVGFESATGAAAESPVDATLQVVELAPTTEQPRRSPFSAAARQASEKVGVASQADYGEESAQPQSWGFVR